MNDHAVVPIKRDEDNPFKVVNQYRRARKLANVLLAHGVNADTLLDGAVASLAATLAGINVPSETTWALTKELVKEGIEA